ncbi:hypothetical protein B7R78_0004460 [Ralstonia solanacearum]|uniref:Uncharacterized protein n=1 Tax=Ralstonia solanacearum K60 TaxID=1091042 RepID=A0AAP7ZNA2_RALSL|nr:hypothetical protein [Ralstonia solanacearum]MBT1536413.1 hypothetical protein [Ralstonia solanacearum]OYQ13539.1 hypothetical protein B7R77_09905 [Ralstonia solanacearum K60]QOK80900.1 hypothetical protein HF906_01115 [Ralstonia solanacearum]CCF97670.1 conserved hypothetical protein [Ralstonia solanacearum K60]
MPLVLPNSRSIEIWEVPLHDHKPYAFVRLQRTFVHEDVQHQVILVDAAKLLLCADRDATNYVLPPAQDWRAGKRNGIRDFLDPTQAAIPEMPIVSFNTRRCRSLLGLLGLAKEGVVSFHNGQHRARYLVFAGATCLPVQVPKSEAAMLAYYCGTTEAPGVRWWLA